MSATGSPQRGIWMLAIGAALVSSPAFAASSPRALIERGNAHYAAGRYTEALEAYKQAAQAEDTPAGAELLHDQAAAQFKLGSLDEARELWVRALSLKDAAFEARVRYNLGNCDYAAVLKTLEAAAAAPPPGATPGGGAPGGAAPGGSAGGAETASPGGQVDANALFEGLDRAIQQYRDALRLDPQLDNARANLELAAQLKKKLEEQATSQSCSQPSSKPGKDKQKNQDQSSQPSSQPSQDQSGDQSESDESQQDQSQTSQPSSAPSPTSQPESAPASQPAQQPSTQPDQESQGEQRDENTPPPNEQVQPSEQTQGTIHLSKEEVERLLQKIRDAEKLRRRVLREREMARQKPVDRDW